MADSARIQLDDDIARCARTILMLRELTTEAKKSTVMGKKVYRNDAALALEHARTIVIGHRRNLEYVRAVYDEKCEATALER